ncbi:unnamed protein product [Brugia pahangi]|uniref:Ovule protein n=1 Tax=Brugia pahangi TaxID=6280 RepID=A0A0N4TNE8_BRUPA|nr:unnamed protein product [Brugia pahangi]
MYDSDRKSNILHRILQTPTNGTLMKSIMDGWMAADWRIRALMTTSARTRSIRYYYYYYYQALLLSSEMSLGLIISCLLYE